MVEYSAPDTVYHCLDTQKDSSLSKVPMLETSNHSFTNEQGPSKAAVIAHLKFGCQHVKSIQHMSNHQSMNNMPTITEKHLFQMEVSGVCCYEGSKSSIKHGDCFVKP